MSPQKMNLNLKNKQNSVMRLMLLLMLMLLCLVTQSLSIKINTTSPATLASHTTASLNKTTKNDTKAANITPSHKFKIDDNTNTHHSNNNNNRNNITILHEVYEEQSDEKPIELNLHEVLPVLKPVKKKPYTLREKPIGGINYEKPSRPIKEYDLHPVTFDFNLGDLEDLTHKVEGDGSTDEKSTEQLSSIEAKHLLSDAGVDVDAVAASAADDDVGMTYLEGGHEENVSDGLDIEIALDEVTSSSNSNSSSNNNSDSNITTNSMLPTSTLATTTVSTSSTGLPTVVTVSPHIFKIVKPNKSTKKERELLKHEDTSKRFSTNFNSLNGLVETVGDGSGDSLNSTTITSAAELRHAANLFQIVTNLYDHFYWQTGDIRAKVTTGCGLEMQAYLTALHGNYEWAQRAYDSSGRYRGQILYGNDKWLGEKNNCYEVNRQLRPEERKHFEFQFFMSVIHIRIWIPIKMQLQLQIGECLPKSCTSADVYAMLTLDPHARMLLNLAYQENGSHSNNTNTTQIFIKSVRPVPGNFSFWMDLKFQILTSFLISLVLLVIVATCYQAKLNRNQMTTPIPAISAKIDAIAQQQSEEFQSNGKGFELYQMRTLNDNNNVIETEHDKEIGKIGDNGLNKQTQSMTTNVDMEKSAQIADYKLETCSSAGADATYEAKKQLGLHEKLLLCFAFQTNSSAILSLDENKESQTSCVHGLRVFSVLWTIMVHTYLQMFNIGENRYRRVIVERSILYQFIGNATFSVDTFFFISGFLVTLLFLRNSKKYPEDTGQFMRRSCLDTIILFIYRYIRLTPAYLFVIFFNDFALRHTSDNSVFQPTVATTTCSQYWWRNILYINNFYPLSEICMIWSWYMANDMQFYLMASLLLVLSTRYFKTAALIVFTFLLSSWGLTGVVSLHHHYTHKVSNPFESFDFLYDKPWQRVGTYIVGMLTGYLIYKVKTPPRIPERLNSLLWLGSFSLLGLVIFGVWHGELNELNTAFYVSIGHTAFGVGLVWIVVSCCWGLSPTWNRILSYPCFWPLSRLTYCTYLIHPVVMLITSFKMDGTVHLNHVFILTIFFGNAVVSFIVAFFISMLFEAPVIRILKICFKK